MRGVRDSYGVVGGWFGFSPFNGLFLSFSFEFCKLSSYSQIGRSGTTRSVPIIYIGPVRGVRASYIVIFSNGMFLFNLECLWILKFFDIVSFVSSLNPMCFNI